MSPPLLLRLLLVVAAAFSCAPAAHAQERDPAGAQALFDEARSLMNARRYTEACAKLAESQRLDPGIGTQFNLAACYEHDGRIASAWATFLEVASLAKASGQTARADAASRRASLLAPRLPRLQIRVPAASRVAGLEITRDGAPVGAAQWDVALPLDPGEHRIEVTAPGHRAFADAVRVEEGASTTFDVPRPVPAATDTPLAATATSELGGSPSPAPSPTAATESSPPGQPTPSDSGSGPGALVLGLGIGGLVLVGTGTALAFVASGKNDDSKAFCMPDDPNACSEEGVALRDDALLMGNLATVGFAVGGAAIVAAGVLWLLDSEGESEHAGAPRVVVSATRKGAAVLLQGRL